MYTCISKSSDKALSCCLISLLSCSLLHPHDSLEARCSPSIWLCELHQTMANCTSSVIWFFFLSYAEWQKHFSTSIFFIIKFCNASRVCLRLWLFCLGKSCHCDNQELQHLLKSAVSTLNALVWIVISHYTLKMKATESNPLLCPCSCNTRIGFESAGSRRCRTRKCPRFGVQSHSIASSWAKPSLRSRVATGSDRPSCYSYHWVWLEQKQFHFPLMRFPGKAILGFPGPSSCCFKLLAGQMSHRKSQCWAAPPAQQSLLSWAAEQTLESSTPQWKSVEEPPCWGSRAWSTFSSSCQAEREPFRLRGIAGQPFCKKGSQNKTALQQVLKISV